MPLTIEIIFTILLLHYIGDFLVQTRWMGENKSTNVNALGAHIFTYFLCLIPLGLTYALANSVLHLITDSVSSRLSKHFYSTNQMHGFWSTIGADQLLHMIALFGTYQFFHQ